MTEYWVWIRTSAGNPIRASVYAENQYRALEMARAMYGDSLISESVNLA